MATSGTPGQGRSTNSGLYGFRGLPLALLAFAATALIATPAQTANPLSGFVDVLGPVHITGDTTAEVPVRYRCSASDFAIGLLPAQVVTPTGYQFLWGGRFGTFGVVATCDGQTHITRIPVTSQFIGDYTPISKGREGASLRPDVHGMHPQPGQLGRFAVLSSC